MDVAPTTTVGKEETKAITAYASVPCDAATGEHEFTITASSKTSDSQIAVIKIPTKQGLFTTSPTNDLMIVVVVFVVFVVAIGVFKDRLGWSTFGSLKKGSKAEEFKKV